MLFGPLLVSILAFSPMPQSVLTTPAMEPQQSCSGKDCAPPSDERRAPAQAAPHVESRRQEPVEDRAAEDKPVRERNQDQVRDHKDKPGDREPDVQEPGESETEFQMLVESSIGKRLPMFGKQFFAGVPSTFAPIERMPARADYLIGPGDELLIRAWGSIELDAKVSVDRNGQIAIPKVGVVSVAGLRSDQVQGYLKTKVGHQFTGFELNVTLGQLRAIQVFLLGNVRSPGSYTVSSLSTMVNALLASGGPGATGSMRNIQLKRMGKVVAHLDLYDLVVSGDKSNDVLLESGDVIYVPPVGPLVAIAGSVNSPAIFELKGATKLGEALEYAGGLNSVAGSKRIVVEAVADRERRTVNEYTLSEGLARELTDGDLVRIFPVSPQFGNAVTLRGAAAQPGRYAWHPGMRLSDLIASRDVLITRNYWINQNALGLNQADLFGSKEAVAPTDFKRNGTEINWSYALLSRLAPDLSTQLITFNLGEAIDHPKSASDIPLQAGDVITVFSQADLSVSVEKRARYVTVVGEVAAPGVYQVGPDETVREVVQAAGGLTAHSYLYAADLRRESVRLEQKEKMKEMISRLRIELSVRAASQEPSTTPEDAAHHQFEMARAQAYLQEMAALEPTGRVVLDVDPHAATTESLPSLPLEDKDVISIPARGGTVDVLGAVNNNNALIYEATATVDDYLAKAGGPTREADLKRSFIIRADGSVYSLEGHNRLFSSKFDTLHLMPGDAIVVPNRLQYSSLIRSIRDWSQIFSQFALGVAAAKVLNQ